MLWNDPATGVMRHADAGYEIAIDCAKEKDWIYRESSADQVLGSAGRWPAPPMHCPCRRPPSAPFWCWDALVDADLGRRSLRYINAEATTDALARILSDASSFSALIKETTSAAPFVEAMLFR